MSYAEFDAIRIGIASRSRSASGPTTLDRVLRPSTTARSSPSGTACSASASLAPPRTGSATAASTRRSATRARSATAAAWRSPGPRCAVSAWATSSWPPLCPTSGTSRAFPPGWACCWTSAPVSWRRCSTSPAISSPTRLLPSGQEPDPLREGVPRHAGEVRGRL